MNVLTLLVEWFSDPAQWTGSAGIPARLGEHVHYSLLGLLLSTAIAVPVGLLTGHSGVGGFLTTSLANFARALPTIGVLFLIVLLAGIGLVLSAGTILVTCRQAKGADRAMILRVALAILLAILCELLVVNFIKVCWGRPRMRLVTSHPEAFFVPWWQLGNALKETLMAAGVAADEFKSFPSGHTANATTMLLLGLVPYLKPQLQKYQKALVAFGFAWAAIVALSRILLGAHYLTDTAVGFLVGFLSVYLICNFLFRSQKQAPHHG